MKYPLLTLYHLKKAANPCVNFLVFASKTVK